MEILPLSRDVLDNYKITTLADFSEGISLLIEEPSTIQERKDRKSLETLMK